MSKFLDFIKKHPVASLSIAVGAVAIIVSGSLFISSVVQYDKYSKDYDDMKTKLLANTPQLPQ